MDKAILREVSPPSAATKQIAVDSEKERALLGVIKWSSVNFGYAFFPSSSHTLNQLHLETISKKVRSLNEAHTKKWEKI